MVNKQEHHHKQLTQQTNPNGSLTFPAITSAKMKELPGKGMNLSITPTTIPALDLAAKIETVHDIKT